jgi:catechol 2,3-dioxygenase-like lactoylglutathione lyase family enzyme
MIKRLSHATIYVLDIEKASKVYTEIFGFKVHTDQVMENGFRWLTVTAPDNPDQEIVLYEVKEGGHLDAEISQHLRAILEKDAMGPGVLEVEDIHATYNELKSKGIEFMQEPTEQFYGIEALMKDGCGNWFSMTQHK